MANQFFVAPSPHVHSAESTTKIMRDVVIALLPALVVSALLFGWSVLGVTALSVVCCVVFEYLIQRFMLRGAPTVGNLSAVVTGVLLAFNLPASIPWWIVVIGAFVAIAIGKMKAEATRNKWQHGRIIDGKRVRFQSIAFREKNGDAWGVAIAYDPDKQPKQQEAKGTVAAEPTAESEPPLPQPDVQQQPSSDGSERFGYNG